MQKERITQERLKELLSFDPSTGVFVWKATRRGKARAGEVAGTFDSYGYRQIKIDGKLYLSHRLAWFFLHGRLPVNQIDHINGVRSDNRLVNLREANSAQNQQNQRMAQVSNRSSGLLGVSWHKHEQRWRAQIKLHGKKLHLGYFDTKEEAHAAYLKAKLEIHPFNTLKEITK